MPAQPDRPRLGVAERRLRILFVVERGALLRFGLLIPALAERGHTVHLAFAPSNNWRRNSDMGPTGLPSRTVAVVERLCGQFSQLSYGLAPKRIEPDGWREVAWLVRGLADLAHSANPRFSGARVLRRRTRRRILPRLRAGGEFEPMGRRVALKLARRLIRKTDEKLSRTVLRITRRLEDAIPTSREVDRYVREWAPDIVVATGTFRHASTEVEVLKSARRLRIPSAVFVTSWDNLTNKGSLKFKPERVFVWNEVQAREAVELHGMPRERVRTTGAHVFDDWFDRSPSRSREQFFAQLGLDPSQPALVYLCSSGNVARPGEVEFVSSWIEALRSSGSERLRRINVIVRPHPNARHWLDVELEDENAVLWPARGIHPIGTDARADFFDTLAHSAAVVGINTTAMIEAAIVGKSVLTVLVPEFAQESTLHFHYLLAENGGFLHVAANLEEHAEQLERVLDEDPVGAERRRRFVESFVRPGGVDQPSAPLAAAAIEELVDVPVVSTVSFATRLLRLGLSLEAWLNATYGFYRRSLRGRMRPGTDLELGPRQREAPH